MDPTKRPAFIVFEDEFKDAVWAAEEATKIPFSRLRRLIAANGGINTVKSLLEDRERFSIGFKRLHNAGLIKHSLETLVLKYADSGLFTQAEIDNARWRLDNAQLAKDDSADV